MGRVRTVFRCSACGAVAPRWAGRCSTCGEWNVLEEEILASTPPSTRASEPIRLADVDPTGGSPRPTGVAEFDRCLGGGLVPGSVTLLGGEPGIGKSTLTLQLAAGAVASGRRALLASAEESPTQIARRAARLGQGVEEVAVVAGSSLAELLAAADRYRPDLLIVDSVQTIADQTTSGSPGSVNQVRACASALVEHAKRCDTTVVLVGHVTKDGTLAGPKVLEHAVDTVLSLEGDRHHALRLLVVAKHRFGETGELGVFSMSSEGLCGVDDPSAMLLADRRPGTPGCVVVPALEGRRPVLVEIQALVAASALPSPRRTGQGIVPGRLALALAVLEQRAGIVCSGADVFVSVIGGLRITEPAADLGLCLALASARTGVALPEDLVACGEVGLGGEVRQVRHTERRLAEARRRGFAQAVIARSAPQGPGTLRVATLAAALDGLGLTAVPAVEQGRAACSA